MPTGTISPAALRRLQPADIVEVAAETAIGLGDDFVGAAEEVEVVHVLRAEIELQRVEHVGGGDADLLGLLAIDVGVDRGRAGGEQREHAGEVGIAVGRARERLGGVRERLRPETAAILQHHLEAAGICRCRARAAAGWSGW